MAAIIISKTFEHISVDHAATTESYSVTVM